LVDDLSVVAVVPHNSKATSGEIFTGATRRCRDFSPSLPLLWALLKIWIL
jgi:hypothetical protein